MGAAVGYEGTGYEGTQPQRMQLVIPVPAAAQSKFNLPQAFLGEVRA